MGSRSNISLWHSVEPSACLCQTILVFIALNLHFIHTGEASLPWCGGNLCTCRHRHIKKHSAAAKAVLRPWVRFMPEETWVTFVGRFYVFNIRKCSNELDALWFFGANILSVEYYMFPCDGNASNNRIVRFWEDKSICVSNFIRRFAFGFYLKSSRGSMRITFEAGLCIV